jgi:hypothetical protein
MAYGIPLAPISTPTGIFHTCAMTNNVAGIDSTEHPETITMDAFSIQSDLGLIDEVAVARAGSRFRSSS